MSLEDIKNILENDFVRQLDITGTKPTIKSKNKKLFKLIHKLNFDLNNAEFIYLLKHKNELENIHIFCPICGKKNPFINSNVGYHNHCSAKCTQNDKNVRKKRIDSCHRHRGNDVNNKQKRRNTLFIKTGNPNYRNHEKHHQTSLASIDKNGMNSYQRQGLHFKETMLNRIDENGLNGFQQNSRKAANIRLNDIDENGMNSYQRGAQKAVNTARNNIDKNGLDSYQRGTQKRRKYYQKLEGVNNYAQTQEHRDKFKDQEWVKQRQIKIYKTNKERGNYGRRSKAEKRCFSKIKAIFPLAEHSYMDENRYPFNCDAYIPELDLFIEFHFGFAHGGEPFDPSNNKHLQEIKYYNIKKEEIRFDGKKKDAYKQKIKTWTIDDPKKLKTFQDNNLNYKIFYTEKEFDGWFNKVMAPEQ